MNIEQNETLTTEEIKEDKKREITEWIKDILIAVVVAIVIMQFIKPTLVKERSMEPNFIENDYLFVSKQSYKLFGGKPEEGDVIVFRSDLKDEKGNKKLLIKRVIGVPDDIISISDGKVTVNGEVIDDSYTKDQYTNGEIEEIKVPKDEYFCMGDNRMVSVDSRYPSVGFVEREDIVGKVVFRLYPFNKIGNIYNPYDK